MMLNERFLAISASSQLQSYKHFHITLTLSIFKFVIFQLQIKKWISWIYRGIPNIGV